MIILRLVEVIVEINMENIINIYINSIAELFNLNEMMINLGCLTLGSQIIVDLL